METWQIIIAIIIVGLSIIMPIYYSSEKKKKAQQEELEKIKKYGETINQFTRDKHKWKNLIKYYQEMSDNSRPMISSKLSKESFDNKLTNSLDVLQTWAYISRDGFRMQIEEILGEPLHWAYRS